MSSYHVSEDKSAVVIVAEKENKRVSMRSRIYSYHFEDSKWVEELKEDAFTIDAAYYFGDGILFVGNKEWKHGYNENGRFYFIDQEKKVTLFYDNEDSLWNSVGSDCRYGSGCQTKIDGSKFYYVSTKFHNSVLMSIDIFGNVCEEIAFDGSVDCFDVCEDTSSIYASIPSSFNSSSKSLARLN